MSFFDFLFPPKCKICKTQLRKGVLCPFCVEKLENRAVVSQRIRTVSEKKIHIYYLFRYDDETVKSLLFALKRKGNRELFSFAARLYKRLIPETECNFAIVNVPRSKENVKKYGFDHVKEPCKIMCKDIENAVYAGVLKRHGKTKEQKNLDAKERAKNVSSKFMAVKKDIPKNILLVDDVVTTMSTASECIRTLLKVYPDAEICCIFLALQEHQIVPANEILNISSKRSS